MRTSARVALAVVVLGLACRRGNADRWVLTDGFLMNYPTMSSFSVAQGAPRENFVAASVAPGETVELVEEREDWSRVRTAKGKEGWIQNPWLVPAMAIPAVALVDGDCYGGQFLGGTTSQTIAPGQLLFVERSRVGRWRVFGDGGLCAWVKPDFLSTESEDVETAKLVHQATRAKTYAEIAGLLEQARTRHPGARAQALVEAAALKLAPPVAPPEYEPPPLLAGEVPASKAEGWACRESAGEVSDVRVPVPEEFPGPYLGDPAFEIHPVQTDGRGSFASAPSRGSVDWKPLVKQRCPWIDRTDSNPGTCSFRVALPEAETAGRWYLATRHGVFAAKPAAIRLRVRTPLDPKVDMKGDLFLRPAPTGGAGFAFWSPAARTFRACMAPMRDPRYTHMEFGLRSGGEPDGKLAILLGEGAATRRARIEREWAPVHSGYKLEIFPGGEFLFVALEDVSYAAHNVEPKSCRPALLLRWSDLAEVARVECERVP